MNAGLGLNPAARPRLQDAQDGERESRGGEDHADDIELRPHARRLVRDPAAQKEDRNHDQDFSGEDVAPRPVRGEEAADQWTDGDGDGTGGRHEPVGPRTRLRREVGGDERDDGRQDQRGADSLEERPADDQDGRECAMAVVNEPAP
jgi:hypothetical protein